jgi:hypothetical protein
VPRSRAKALLQKELERFGELVATEKADVQINVWNRTKAEVVADLEKLEHEGDEFFERPTGGWSKATAGGVKATLNRACQLPFPTKGVAAVSLDSARFVVQEWRPSGGNFPQSKAKAATGA